MLGMIDPAFMDDIFKVILNKEDIRPLVESLESYEIGQVLDEISIYLKQKMLLNDIKYELHILDRFFRIIADSKQLLNMNSDSGFVLILTLSKMIEAINVKTIDQAIEDVKNINIATDIKSVVKEIDSQPVEAVTLKNKILEPKAEENNSDLLFKKLIENIYNKSYDLGECFEKSFIFSSYENNILKINSRASGNCKTLLYKNFSHIKSFVSDIFGETTELEFEKIIKEPTKEMARIVQPSNNNHVGSMIEDIELHEDISSSCIEEMSKIKNPNLSQVELNANDILNSKMVNTVMKLFQTPSTPRVKSKL
jgi:DNA polymerase-3 subunit gamma/tau